jgi:thrombospondin motif-containing protein 18
MFIVDFPKPPTEDTYLRFDEYGNSGRPRRSAGKTQKGLNVETLVVADRKMVEKHGKGNVTTYILTVMNMVREVIMNASGSAMDPEIIQFLFMAGIADIAT